MKWFLSNIVALLAATTCTAAATTPPEATTVADTVYVTRVDTVYIHTSSAADSIADVAPYARRLDRYYKFWGRLIPRGVRVQYAGNMGMFSAGPTWIYGKRHWETSLMLGFVPKHNAHHGMLTMTIKQDYLPWSIHFDKVGLDFQPLATGFYFNTAFSHKLWVHQPSRYPKGYYWFATRLRSNIYIGERLKFNIPENRRKGLCRSISLFYELSTCDYYFIQKVKNSYITPDKWVTLSFGIQIEWL